MTTKSPPVNISDHIVYRIKKSNIPLSAEEIVTVLNDNGVIYSYRHIKRIINQLQSAGILERVAKRGKIELYGLPGQAFEPFEATVTNNTTVVPHIKLNGKIYSPDELARGLMKAPNTVLTEQTYTDLQSLLVLSLLGNAAWETLSAHSLTPVAHIRKPLLDINDRLKTLSAMIDTILDNATVKTGAIGTSISNETRDNLLEDLERWIMQVSTNIRSNIE